MSIPFNLIPGNIRVPGFFVEVDKSAANQGGADILRTLLVGQRRSTGTISAGVLTRVTSAAQVGQFFGLGSMLHLAAKAYFANDSFGEVWAVALDDDAGGTKSISTIQVATIATAAGVIPLYIGGRLVNVALLGMETKAQTAAAIKAACDLVTDLAGVASTDGIDTVSITALHKGAVAGRIDVRTCALGSAAGEQLPATLALTISQQQTPGVADPSVTVAIDAMADEPFEFIAWPYSETTTLGLIATEMADSADGRWGPLRQLYGHVVSFKGGTLATLGSYGAGLNDPHLTMFGCKGMLETQAEIAAAACGQIATSIRVDPARPLQTLPLIGIHAPSKDDKFLLSERNSLLFDGVATLTSDQAGVVRIERAITTYQKNAYGSPDASELDSETLFTLAAIMRRLKTAITSKYGRHKLVSDGTRIGAGQAAVSPSTMRAELVAEYRAMESDGLVENADAFKAALIVERNSQDPNRLDVLFPPDLVNGLRVFAMLNQFRLQYPAAAA